MGVKNKLLDLALDMSHQARMARAKEQGFDTDKVWYHGTKNQDELRAFSNEHLGANTGARSAAAGHFFTRDPEVASKFAGENGAVLPVLIRDDSSFIDGSIFGVRGGQVQGSYGPVTNRDGSPYMEWKVDPHAGLFHKTLPGTLKKPLPEMTADDVRKWAEAVSEGGVSGVDLPGTHFDGVIDSWHGRQRPHDVRIAFNPSQIRSVNAAFDPAKKDSSNLLASLAGGGVLAGSMLPSEEASAAELVQSTGPDRGQIANQLMALAQQGDANPDVAQNIQGSPLLLSLARSIENNTQSPLGGSHVQGIVDLLRKWGYREQAKPVDYVSAGLDVL